jgi:mevalonate kinase
MTVKATRSTDLDWVSLDVNNKEWFKSSISLYDFSATETTNQDLSDKLKKIFKGAVRLNCEFLDKWNAFKIETKLEFDQNWGLGSSSTLIYLVAKWADIEPIELYFKVENGSGYDVVTAGSDTPIEFWSTEDEVSYNNVKFDPKFKDQLLFIHMNQKVKSEDEVKRYLSAVNNKKDLVTAISNITEEIQSTTTLDDFSKLIVEHENLIAKHTGFDKVKDQRFKEYTGSVKSLGAWGGDFIIATAPNGIDEAKKYFNSKGYNTLLKYSELIL